MNHFTPNELDIVTRIWTQLGDRDPAGHTGIVATVNGQVKLGIATRDANIAALTKTALTLANTPQGATMTSLLEGVTAPRPPGTLRIIWMGRSEPIVTDTTREEVLLPCDLS